MLHLHLSLGYVTTIIEDAKIYATHAKKSNVDSDDIRLAIQCRMDQSFTSPPPRDVSPEFLLLQMCQNIIHNVICYTYAFLSVSPGGGQAEESNPSAPD